MHGLITNKHRLTRLTTAQIWENPPPSPLYYSMCPATGPPPKYHFVPRFPSLNPKIFEIGSLTTLEAHNFFFKPSIEMRSKKKLQPLLRAFQQYVARHQHAINSRRFLTFNGWESNCQFDSRLSFSHNLFLKTQMGHASPF